MPLRRNPTVADPILFVHITVPNYLRRTKRFGARTDLIVPGHVRYRCHAASGSRASNCTQAPTPQRRPAAQGAPKIFMLLTDSSRQCSEPARSGNTRCVPKPALQQFIGGPVQQAFGKTDPDLGEWLRNKHADPSCQWARAASGAVHLKSLATRLPQPNPTVVQAYCRYSLETPQE